MYCAGCGNPIAPGLSFCNRCGTSLKERNESKRTGPIGAIVTAMVIVGVSAMGMLLGGPIALKREGQFDNDIIAFFMFFTFIIGALTEILLYRQLGRLTTATRETLALPTPSAMPAEFRAPQPRTLAEPAASVTENTTRTLEYQERGK